MNQFSQGCTESPDAQGVFSGGAHVFINKVISHSQRVLEEEIASARVWVTTHLSNTASNSLRAGSLEKEKVLKTRDGNVFSEKSKVMIFVGK